MTGTGVQDALASVPEEYYTHREDGGLVRQSSSAEAIAAGLERLDVRPGTRVLEVGTGSGFSGALLGEIVGEGGSVVSVDVVEDLVARARDLHARRSADNVLTVAGDGARGVPEHSPYDRIVAWASSDLLHRSWVEQCAPGAVLVVPVTLTDLPRTNAIVRVRLGRDGAPEADRLWPGGYVEMHPTELTQWLVPPNGVSAQATGYEGEPWWASGDWIDRRPGQGRELVESLAERARTEEGPFSAGESVSDFHAYLYAVRPGGLSMFGLGTRGWAPGYACHEGAAVSLGDGRVVAVGEDTCVRRLRGWVDNWRRAGGPGAGDLVPVLEPVAGGWLVRARLRGEVC